MLGPSGNRSGLSKPARQPVISKMLGATNPHVAQGGQAGVQSAQRPQVDVGGRLREFRKKTSSGRDLLQVQNGGRSLRCGNGLPVPAVGGGASAISKFAPAAFCVIHLFRYSLLLHWNDTGKGSQVPPWTSRQFTAVQHRQILLHLRPI